MSHKTLKAQEHVHNDTKTPLLRLELKSPNQINSNTSATLAFYASHASQFTQYDINSRYILSLEVTNLVLKLRHQAGGLCTTTMGVRNLYTSITLRYLSILRPTN